MMSDVSGQDPTDALAAVILKRIDEPSGSLQGTTSVHVQGTRYFCKIEPVHRRDRLVQEARGLNILRDNSRFHLPTVERIFDAKEYSCLVTEWLDLSQSRTADWASAARKLAELHSTRADRFGFPDNNYIGESTQTNTESSSWVEFFAERRLVVQQQIAVRSGVWRSEWNSPFERLVKRLDSILPDDIVPSLCHGDLWSGNIGWTVRGAAVYDPAVYYGHYETDLAMTHLFGGFPQAFYDAYALASPLEAGFLERIPIYNLYHVLNHLNIFGRSYEHQVGSILARYA